MAKIHQIILNEYHSGIYASNFNKEITLKHLFDQIEKPYNFDSQKLLFEKIFHATKSERDRLKEQLRYTIPSANMKTWRNSRTQENIDKFTGVICLDFDNVERKDTPILRDKIFNELPYCIGSFLSPSYRGVKALISIPICKSVEEFKCRYNALKQHLKPLFPALDTTSSGPQLPMFYAYDPSVKCREEFKTFKDMLLPEKTFKQRDVFEPVKQKGHNRKRIDGYLNTMFNKITSDGHVQVRSIGIIMGGYSATGYITINELITEMNFHIDNNAYLSRSAKLNSKYKSTAKSAINYGYSFPKTLTTYETN